MIKDMHALHATTMFLPALNHDRVHAFSWQITGIINNQPSTPLASNQA
jgi:hypothetical protein